jgi:CheY-like chemotaxis protein
MDKKSVLIVDDDWLQVNVLSQILWNEGYTIDVASNGFQAMEKITERKYSVVVLDFMLPYYTGDQLAEKIRKDYPDTKIILVTGMLLAMYPGDTKLFNRILEKPIKATELIKALKEITGMQASETEQKIVTL